MGRVVHFEICAEDPDRAAKFYSDVFGWEIQNWGGPIDYRLVMTGEESAKGIDGGIRKRETPEEKTINTIDVASLDESLKKIQEAGGKVIMPKSPIPGVGYMAYCRDTEDIVFGVMEADTSAK